MKVTIAIPFYNDGKYFAQAIQSVLNQTYQDYELILINDGSTDNSLKIAQEYASRDSRIIVISDGENCGLAVRLNQSIKIAKGEYYMLLHMWKLEYKKKQHQLICQQMKLLDL